MPKQRCSVIGCQEPPAKDWILIRMSVHDNHAPDFNRELHFPMCDQHQNELADHFYRRPGKPLVEVL